MLENYQLTPEVIDQLKHPKLFRQVVSGNVPLAMTPETPIDKVQVGGPIAKDSHGEIRVLFTLDVTHTDAAGNKELEIEYHGYTRQAEITPKQREEHLNAACSIRRRLPHTPATSHNGSVL